MEEVKLTKQELNQLFEIFVQQNKGVIETYFWFVNKLKLQQPAQVVKSEEVKEEVTNSETN